MQSQSKREQREARAKAARDLLDKLNAERVAAGVCRHCGGPVPCWSPYGDIEVGVRQHPSTRRAW